MSEPMSPDTAVRLIEFARAAEAVSPTIHTRGRLQSEIKRVLVVSLATNSRTFLGDTATELATVHQRAMEEYYSNPQFKAIIDATCMEIMRTFDRYEPLGG